LTQNARVRRHEQPAVLIVWAGIKEYSDWPTIPQLYIDKEFMGGCDILMNMHRDGSLAQMLSEKKLVIEEDEPVDGGHPSPS
jgi:glutaredoxin-related protein